MDERQQLHLMKKILLYFLFSFLVMGLTLWAWMPSTENIKGCIKTSMFNIDLCPGSKSYVPLSQISKNVQNSILITEDSGFYQHSGFDSNGIQRCFEKIKEKRRIVCGGSTITQQLAKNVFLWKEKNFLRKGLEALITYKIENTLKKKEILERYLNVVQFGKNVFGIKQAAFFYFKKNPGNLNVHEAAFLAMVLPNPEKYSQSYYRKDLTQFARRRLAQIIENMYKYKRISSEEYITALDNLDLFLKSGQTTELTTNDTEILSEADLEALDEELAGELENN